MTKQANTKTLNELCSEDQLELLKAIDRLRLQGIDHYISLPQIIVCGDQSSGKSSVLEAISGVLFPVKSNLCTRFPTELVLRRSDQTDVTVSIVPHSSLGLSEQKRLSSFRKKLDGFEGFPQLVEEAQAAMGISTHGKAFSKDLLRIEITGADRPHLTIIDLPGLIHSETKQQSAADVGLVREVVEAYMKQRRSIVLAVVSAKNDYANQVVLKLARDVDKKGARTMGVITKPDTLIPGSGSEADYISLAQNQEVQFDLGWHVLKNLDSETQKGPSLLGHRNSEEADFFSGGIWEQLPSSSLGINQLRNRLSSVLLRQIALELPSLICEIGFKLDGSSEQLQKLGEPHSTFEEQRLQLLQISQDFQSVVKNSINGIYNDALFSEAESEEGYSQRIRAVIQNLNKQFADELAQWGHKREISDTELAAADDDHEGPLFITRLKFVDHVQNLMQRSRGRELPGIFNSMITAELFHDQSAPWEIVARNHISRAWAAAKAFLKSIIEHVAHPSIKNALFQRVFEPALNNLLTVVNTKTTELLGSHRQIHPITYDQQYSEAIRSISDNQRKDRTEEDVERVAACKALDCMHAYYGVSMKRFVDDVAVEVIERELLSVLPEIFSPVAVFTMPIILVGQIAGESQQSLARRKELTTQIEVLRNGSNTCKRFVDVRLGEDTNDEPPKNHSDKLEELQVPRSPEMKKKPNESEWQTVGRKKLGPTS
ncbi:dynamin family protein [Whalleya microplaca]|nr:dynamin family protein [Whalleya microplaca]